MAALAAVGLAFLCLSGCSNRAESDAAMSAADLQIDLAGRLVGAGTPAGSVLCEKELPARVGAVARCEVTFNDIDSVDAVLTTIQVRDSIVSYEITRPDLTRDQLNRRVANLAGGEVAACGSGLDGYVGAWAECEVTANREAAMTYIEVTAVRALVLDLDVTRLLPRQQVQDVLLDRLAQGFAQRPDSAECAGDLIGIQGSTMECVVTTNSNPNTYVLTVTGVDGGTVEFDYSAKGGAAGEDADIDLCRGCPG